MSVDPISGGEHQIDPRTPLGAVADFYRAFNERDLVALERNWLSGEAPVMDNPVGGIVRGWPAIRAVYEKLISSEGRVQVEFYDYTLHTLNGAFLVVGRERGYFTKGTLSVDLAIRTSRWFQHVDGRYRQLHHHGSIDDPVLLCRYQEAVLAA